LSGRPLECHEVELELGVLLLGALDPTDRADVEDHLRACPSCAVALAELAPLLGLLRRVEFPELALEGPPSDLLDRTVAAGRALDQQDAGGVAALSAPAASAGGSERPAGDPSGPALEPARAGGSSGSPGSGEEPGRAPGAREVTAPVDELAARRRNRRAAGAGLAAAAAVALLLGVAVSRSMSAETVPVAATASASNAATNVSATVAMNPISAGTELALRLSGVEPGQRCSLVVVSDNGSREVASSWLASYDGEADVVGTTSLTTSEISRFDITLADGTTLLQIPA
jgi:hypothetical protein